MDRLSDAIASVCLELDQQWARVDEASIPWGDWGERGQRKEKAEDGRLQRSPSESRLCLTGKKADVANQPPVLQSRGQPRVGEAQHRWN